MRNHLNPNLIYFYCKFDSSIRIENERRRKEQKEREEQERRIQEERRLRELQLTELHRTKSGQLLSRCVAFLTQSAVAHWQLKLVIFPTLLTLIRSNSLPFFLLIALQCHRPFRPTVSLVHADRWSSRPVRLETVECLPLPLARDECQHRAIYGAIAIQGPRAQSGDDYRIRLSFWRSQKPGRRSRPLHLSNTSLTRQGGAAALYNLKILDVENTGPVFLG